MPEAESEPVLALSVHDVRYISALLRGVHFTNRATITITSTGFLVTVEESHTVTATAYIFRQIFDEYTYHHEEPPASLSSDGAGTQDTKCTMFEIQLNILIDCLNIFGSANLPPLGTGTKRWRKAENGGDHDDDDDNFTAGGGRIDQYFGGGEGKRTGMRMKYLGAGYPLTLFLAEDSSGPTTTCEIATFDPDPQFELPFDSSPTVLKIILKSSWLRDALSELDPTCDRLSIIGNPPPTSGSRAAPSKTKPILRLQANGTWGSTEMDYPNDREVLETVECASSVRFSYRFGHIARTLRALQSSTKTSLRINADGLLSLQFLMPINDVGGKPSGTNAFIEYRCIALAEG